MQRPIPLCVLEYGGPPGAADAFANANFEGTGGYWLPDGAPCSRDSAFWFSFQLRKRDLPWWFKSPDSSSLQACVAALEALAQLILTILFCEKSTNRLSCFSYRLKQLCDNQSVVSAAQSSLSQQEPLCFVLQARGFHSSRLGVFLHCSHIAGCRNTWADALSRDHLDGFNPDKRVSLDILEMLRVRWT